MADCPAAVDGVPSFVCPTQDKNGQWICFEDYQLCDGVRNCPNGDDENQLACSFYQHFVGLFQVVSSMYTDL